MLLTLTEVANREGIDVPEAEVEEQVALARARYQDQKTVRYFESERGRNFIRSTLRRTRLVETLVDRWLAAHPEHPPLPHLEDDAPSALDSPQAEANAALDATDPGAIPGPDDDQSTPPRTRPSRPSPPPPARQGGSGAPDRGTASLPSVHDPDAGEAPDARPDGHRVHQPW